MASTTDSSQTPKQGTSIDEALGQTEFGGWIAENKTPVLSAIILLIVGVFAFGGYRQYTITKNNENSDRLYTLVNEKLPTYEKGELQGADLVASISSSWQEMGYFTGGIPFIIQVSDALRKKGDLESAHAILMTALEQGGSAQARYFLLTRAAALAEDLGKSEMAINHLKEVLSSGVKYMEGKTYLDLGRLYRNSGQPDLAKTSFEWVVEKGEQAEFKKMAQLYLDETN